MSLNVNPLPNGKRKSLFSIQVDDVIIQRVFKSIEDEVRRLRADVEDLGQKVNDSAKRSDFLELEATVSEIKDKTYSFTAKVDNTVDDFSHTFESNMRQLKSYVREEVSNAVFSVNNVVKAQNALMEEKFFNHSSEPIGGFNKVVADVDRMKFESRGLRDDVAQIKEFFASFLGSADDKRTLPEIIAHSLQADREQIKLMEHNQNKVEKRLKTVESNLYKIIGSNEPIFPLFGKAPKQQFSGKPKIPKLDSPKSYTDYFEYLMNLAPQLQKILSAYYHQLIGITNSVYDKEEKENTLDDLEQSLKQMNDIIADIRELRENEKKIDDLSIKVDEISSSQPIISDIMASLKQIKETMVTKVDVNDEIKQATSGILAQFQLDKNDHNSYNDKSSTTSASTVNTNSNKYEISLRGNQENSKMSRSKGINYNNNCTSYGSYNRYYNNNLNDQNDMNNDTADISNANDSNNDDDINDEDDRMSNENNENLSSFNNSPPASPKSAQSQKYTSNLRIFKPEKMPVVAAVLPRGRASFQMIYGDGKGRPATSRLNVRRKDDFEEGGKGPKRIQRAPIRSQFPDDVELPPPEPTNIYYSNQYY
ncbi:hypothetical protein TRFO_08187 [Tritrichomonas foetus]|uniref:Uncharacterized protein n=1 Tax=Tritrichomonas foetus TaxID=1144522 RepID=A0A1J4JLC0_9EUKA|nr:hypothetical protein TRFO_08187 [Tritrichomonas foetus]|eukprot:OHS99882.1 hypothetical protein TRFO_08187 [Tritrichomonas foetus]